VQDRHIHLFSVHAIVAAMHTECTHGYKLHCHKLGLDPDCNTAGDVIIGTGPEPTVSEPFRAYAQVFFEADSESMPSRSPQDLAIKLLNSKQLPWGPIYNLIEKELKTLASYPEVQPKRD
jgi:hypothetical protein